MKVKSPIFSDGRGKLGKNVVGAMWKGIWYLRSYVVPSNPKTNPQKAVRDMMRLAVADAQVILETPANLTEWNKAALPDGVSGFNLLVKDWTGSPVLPDSYSAAVITKISGAALSIPRGEVKIGHHKVGDDQLIFDCTVGGVAPAYEIVLSAEVLATLEAGSKLYLADNRVFEDTVDVDEIAAKFTSHYNPNKDTGVAVECILTA